VDSRVRAREWLQRHTSAADRVLVAADIAFLPTELRRIHAHIVTVAAKTRLQAPDPAQFGYIVVGSVAQSGVDWIAPGWKLVASFGNAPTPTTPAVWRGNDEAVRIFRRTH
jgi:hypothetical protein